MTLFFMAEQLSGDATKERNSPKIYMLIFPKIKKEKVQPYQKRLKIRDLYDIFFLLRYVNNKELVKEDLTTFIKNFKNPLDAPDLRAILLESLVPSVSSMLNYISKEAT